MHFQLKKKVMEIIASRRSYPFFSLATCLYAISLGYQAGIRCRAHRFDSRQKAGARLSRPVISVGNITLGGTGKTPMTIYLAKMIRQVGYLPVILSRGYKGDYSRNFAVVSDGRKLLMDARQAGDEPYLMASLLENLPVVVGRDRYAAGVFAIQHFSPDFILLDDGYQHRQLARDLNLLLLDAGNPFGNGYLFPRGSLREMPQALERAHAIIFTRFMKNNLTTSEQAHLPLKTRPTFRSVHKPVIRGRLDRGSPYQDLAGMVRIPSADYELHSDKLFAFSGLAENTGFWQSIKRFGGCLKGTMGFADHHRYCCKDLERIQAAAEKCTADSLITTDKDYVRLPACWRWKMPLVVMGVDIDFNADQERWQRFILRHIEDLSNQNSRNSFKFSSRALF